MIMFGVGVGWGGGNVIVQFQKISIPPPRREFHIGPPHPPGFSIFEVFF